MALKVALDKKARKIVCGLAFACVTYKGEIYIWGDGTALVPTKVSGVQFKDAAVGHRFVVATDCSHTMWTWGSNESGELGHDDT